MSKKNSTRLTNLSVTVYPGSALVQGKYSVKLDEGRNKFELQGLPAYMDPKSVHVHEFSGPGEVTLGPISYRAGNLNPTAQMQRSINKKVTVIFGGATKKDQQQVRGRLLSLAGNVALLKVKGKGVQEIRNVVGFTYDKVADGLFNTASLSLTVDAEKKGTYEITLLYRANGLNWDADYKWIVDEKTGTVKWDASVFVTNGCGTSFPDASLKVVAGDAGNQQYDAMPMAAPMAALESMGGGARAASAKSRNVRQAEVQNLGQVKVYTVPGATTIEEGEGQKVPFVVRDSVPLNREYRVGANHYWHARGTDRVEQDVNSVFIFENNEDSKLGLPLPGGTVSIMQMDESGALLQNGGGRFSDTAVGDKIELDSGKDFDLKATRVLCNVHREEQPHKEASGEGANRKPAKRKVIQTKECSIELFNGKDREVEFVVSESLNQDCEFQGKHGLVKVTAGNWEAKVKVAPGKTEKLDFVVVQTSIEDVEDEE